MAQTTVARLRDALVPVGTAALPRAGCQTRIGRDLAPIGKAAEQRLQPDQRAELGADALQPRQHRGRVLRVDVDSRLDQRITFALDRGNLSIDQIEPIDLPPDFHLEPIRQRTPVAGLQCIEPGVAILAERIVVGNALPREQPLDPVGVLDALLEQRAALARQTTAVLLGRAGWPHHRTDPSLPACPGHQRAQQCLSVDRVRLDPTVPPVDRNRWIQNPSRPASWMATTSTDISTRRSAVRLSRSRRSTSARRSPPATAYFENLSLPGALAVTSHADLLSSRETKSLLLFGRAVVCTLAAG